MARKIFELFGKPLSDQTLEATRLRQQAQCPFTSSDCDGGGNRHQTTISLAGESAELRDYFSGLDLVIPGVCSIQSDNETWLVCPRRLFGVKDAKASLLPHELLMLQNMDFPRGVPLSIWAEVNLSLRDEDSSFNYHFDYVIALTQHISLQQLRTEFADDPQLLKDLRHRAVEGVLEIPDLSQFAIIEVMTASTSGSNTVKGTDIRSAFKKAVLGQPHSSPGINKRQVWGRMATQLFAKSACAEHWGGKTYWLLQDEFLAEIEKTTGLSSQLIEQGGVSPKDTVNLVVFNVNQRTGETSYLRVLSGSAGLPFADLNHSYTGILLPKKVPAKRELLRGMLRRQALMRVTL